MIMPEEKLMEALRICASHDKSQCPRCPYYGWCGDTVNPHMNMQKDALEVIQSQKNLIFAFSQTFRGLHKYLAKASHDLERYGKRIREQREEILNLLAMLDAAAAGQETLQKAFANADRCASCGKDIPEGRQVCPSCENTKGEEK